MQSFNYTIPDQLVGKVQVSNLYQNYNSRGNPTSFGIDLYFHELQLSKTVKSSEFYVLRGKIEDLLRKWESMYQRHLDKLFVKILPVKTVKTVLKMVVEVFAVIAGDNDQHIIVHIQFLEFSYQPINKLVDVIDATVIKAFTVFHVEQLIS